MQEVILSPESAANLDETGLRMFALEIMTLHWRGGKDVPIDKALTSKLCLSIVIVWFEDGTLDLIVVWTSSWSTKLSWSDHIAVFRQTIRLMGTLHWWNLVHACASFQNDKEGDQCLKQSVRATGTHVPRNTDVLSHAEPAQPSSQMHHG